MGMVGPAEAMDVHDGDATEEPLDLRIHRPPSPPSPDILLVAAPRRCVCIDLGAAQDMAETAAMSRDDDPWWPQGDGGDDDDDDDDDEDDHEMIVISDDDDKETDVVVISDDDNDENDIDAFRIPDGYDGDDENDENK